MYAESYLSEYSPPAGRRPSKEIVRRLRAIVPEAELIYLGKGTWSLGTVRHNRLVHRATLVTLGKIYQMLGLASQGAFHLSAEHKRELHSRLYTLHLHRQGFRPIQLYTLPDPDGSIVLDLQEREWRYRHDLEGAIKRSQAEMQQASGEQARIDRVLEYLRSEYKSIHRFAFRGKRSFVSKGLEKLQDGARAAKDAASNLLTRRAS